MWALASRCMGANKALLIRIQPCSIQPRRSSLSSVLPRWPFMISNQSRRLTSPSPGAKHRRVAMETVWEDLAVLFWKMEWAWSAGCFAARRRCERVTVCCLSCCRPAFPLCDWGERSAEFFFFFYMTLHIHHSTVSFYKTSPRLADYWSSAADKVSFPPSLCSLDSYFKGFLRHWGQWDECQPECVDRWQVYRQDREPVPHLFSPLSSYQVSFLKKRSASCRLNLSPVSSNNNKRTLLACLCSLLLLSPHGAKCFNKSRLFLY